MKKVIMAAIAAQMAGFAAAQSGDIPSVPIFKDCAASIAAKLYQTPDHRLLIEAELWKEFPALNANVENIVQIATALKSQGVTLVPILLPLKPMVEGDINGSPLPVMKAYDRAAAVGAYRAVLQQLRARGLIAPDIAAAMTGQKHDMFFRGDHHITPQGAHVIAEATAALVKNLPAYQAIPEVNYQTTENGTLIHPDPSRSGALVSLCGPQPAELVKLRTTKRGQEAGLLDEAAPEIVYVGTSNGRGTWNLNGEFQQALSRDVLDAHLEAGGAYTPLMNYLLSSSYKEAKPKIILWEWNIEESFYNRDGSYVFNAPETYQTVIPAIYGACDKQNPLQFTAQAKTIDVDLQPPSAASSQYLHMTFSDPTTTSAVAEFIDARGQHTHVTIDIPTRLTHRTETYIAVPKTVSPFVKASVKLLPEGDGPSTAQVCSISDHK